MAPIPLRQDRALHGTHGTARKLRVGIGIRAVSSNPSGTGLASPPLIVALVAVGLLSLTMFSMFGRRVLEASRHRRRNQNEGATVASETTGRGEDHYLLLADMLGLSVPHRRRTPQPPVPNVRPKMWDIQYHARPPGVESHKEEHPLCWGDIMPIAVMVSEKRSRVRNSVQATPSPLPRSDRRTCRLFRWLCRRGRRRMPVGETGHGEVVQEQGPREKPRVPRKDIQVVVAIAMPCRPRRDQDVRMSYSIGVHAIPWDGEDL